MLLSLYKTLTILGTPLLRYHFKKRMKSGKEDKFRINERFGNTDLKRPEGPLLWFHAASVGEAQSLLVLINLFLKENPQLHILVTTGTVTSAELLQRKLPERSFHQFMPVDSPHWVKKFLDHWQPNMIIFTESELWPNMIVEIGRRHLPSALINARLSDKSYRNWKRFKGTSKEILSVFDLILTQTDQDKDRFEELGCQHVSLVGNIKYCAEPLPYDEVQLDILRKQIDGRPTWLYASTHDGEEQIACESHIKLKDSSPKLLTLVALRHPDRRDEVAQNCSEYGLNIVFRGDNGSLPTPETDIYCIDTLGELGLFYRLTDIAMIGRSLSYDGGGGHNPIEAAQLSCAIITGRHYQYQKELFRDFTDQDAALVVDNKDDLLSCLSRLLSDDDYRHTLVQKAACVSDAEQNILVKLLRDLEPLFLEGEIHFHPSLFRYTE